VLRIFWIATFAFLSFVFGIMAAIEAFSPLGLRSGQPPATLERIVATVLWSVLAAAFGFGAAFVIKRQSR
jgi:hypothetical protein